MKSHKTGCDACGKNILLKDSWVSMWVMITDKGRPIEMKNAWITCHPSVCAAAKQFQNTPIGIRLYDHTADVIASDAEHWALDYNAKPELMVNMLIRLAPLIKQPRPEKE